MVPSVRSNSALGAPDVLSPKTAHDSVAPQDHASSSVAPRTVRGRLLVLENDDGIAQLMRSRLTRLGYDVVTARSPVEVAEPTESFDLLILDYNLDASHTGLGFYESSKRSGINIPAILVTGFGDERILTQAIRLGVRDFLPKTNDFLENLPIVIARVMNDIERERQLEESKTLRKAQSEVQAALDAAGIDYWNWSYDGSPAVWPTRLMERLGIDVEAFKESPERLLELVHPDDRERVLTTVADVRANYSDFEIELRTAAPLPLRRLRVKGRFNFDGGASPRRITGMLWDETAVRENEIRLVASLKAIEELAERLKLSMMETHHRVKNSFQIVSSLLNMELRRKSKLTAESVRKVVAHVQGLAAIHDILTDHVKTDRNPSIISVRELVERLVDILRNADSSRRFTVRTLDVGVSARIASSLSVIATELVVNALKYGDGDIGIQILQRSPSQGTLRVSNPTTVTDLPDSRPSSGSTGLDLVRFLARVDLESGLEYRFEEGHLIAEISFPVAEESEALRRLTLRRAKDAPLPHLGFPPGAAQPDPNVTQR